MATLSTHVLNGVDGTHAGGVAIRLVNLTTGVELLTAATDAGGRLSEIVDLSAADVSDLFELTFESGSYWREQGMEGMPIVGEITLRFVMPVRDARYHIPVILSPNSHSCWMSVPERLG